jgi:hypothetical protein
MTGMMTCPGSHTVVGRKCGFECSCLFQAGALDWRYVLGSRMPEFKHSARNNKEDDSGGGGGGGGGGGEEETAPELAQWVGDMWACQRPVFPIT